jgi:hypothetical protein
MRPVLELRFKTEELRDHCCDMDRMTKAWGAESAACVARRLQQLAAMTSLDDMAFLPCESSRDADGRLRVGVDAKQTIVLSDAGVRRVRDAQGHTVSVLMVEQIATRDVDGEGHV